ncbi:glutathione S-transferase N-terminal domain-containing protein [Leptospira sp. GIMC2001]|uniref:glutathione S-transferase N-terminal domain-containing protein n=1 Tax=Leptospira sp. GIMC2001 TaxID=1513297 RepID=UPI00234B3AF7|nr:glutathione S-transferase N-terminal domain-containing protein [Leptospira sp. GIMC2001]WCL51139.1 glutathione S-transferase N-terminal domain-containing protein [Leptospira sp. GIMC2001]
MIKIYQFPTCPYCARVIRTLDSLGLESGKDYELIEAYRGTKGREEVVQLGGINQVPFMVDGETKMYESNDIIHYLKNKFQA